LRTAQQRVRDSAQNGEVLLAVVLSYRRRLIKRRRGLVHKIVGDIIGGSVAKQVGLEGSIPLLRPTAKSAMQKLEPRQSANKNIFI
jgi:hypothetical protein